MYNRWKEDKGQKRTDNPLNLTPEDRSRIDNLIVGGERDRQRARAIFDNHQTNETEKQYGRVIKDFREFCEGTEGLSYDSFGEKEIINYVNNCIKRNKGYQWLAGIKPGLERVEELRGIEKLNTAFTGVAVKMIAGAKKMAAQMAPPVRKKEAIPVKLVERILQEKILPYKYDVMKINLEIFRTVYKWVIQAKTICRLEEFLKLRAEDFRPLEEGDGIMVSFCRGAKNDQMHRGSERALTREVNKIICPYELTIMYFERCNLRMVKGDKSFVCCAINRNGDAKKIGITRQTAAAGSEKLLRMYGEDPRKYGETSGKRLGVTEAFNKGVPIDKIQEIGNWRTPEMPLRYIHATDRYKVSLAKQLSFGADRREDRRE